MFNAIKELWPEDDAGRWILWIFILCGIGGIFAGIFDCIKDYSDAGWKLEAAKHGWVWDTQRREWKK